MINGEAIATARFSQSIDTGVRYGNPLVGIVPEIEEREAALFCGYNWKEWQELPRYERVDGVAHFRLHHLIELARQDAVNSYMENKTKQAKRKK